MKATKEFMRRLEAAHKVSNEFYAERGSDSVVLASPGNQSLALKIQFEEPFENDVKIYSISDFMSFIRIFEEPDIEFGEEYATIRSNGRFSRFVYSSMVDPVKVWREKNEFDVYGNVKLSEKDLNDIARHHRIAMTDNVIFRLGEKCSVVSSTFVDGQIMTENFMEIDIDGQSEMNVDVVFSDKYFFAIQPRDYEVTFARSRKRSDVHLAFFENEVLSYVVVATEAVVRG